MEINELVTANKGFDVVFGALRTNGKCELDTKLNISCHCQPSCNGFRRLHLDGAGDCGMVRSAGASRLRTSGPHSAIEGVRRLDIRPLASSSGIASHLGRSAAACRASHAG